MRIAVCLSGQPRSIEFAKKSLLAYFKDDENHTYDFFCHTWDYNTWKIKPKKIEPTWHESGGPEFVDRVWLADQLMSFKPKACMIGSHQDLMRASNYEHLIFGDSLFYSAMIANQMKKQYEIDNGFKYDMVVKCRYDIVYTPGEQAPWKYTASMPERTIFFSHCGRMPLEYNEINASDCVYFGDSWGMDITSDIFRTLRKYNSITEDDWAARGPGCLLSNYLWDYNVLVAHAHFSEIFYRKEVLGKDAIDDFAEIVATHEAFYN